MPAIDPAFDTGGMSNDDEKKKDPSRSVNPTQDRPQQQDRNYVTVQRDGGYTPSPLSPYISAPPVSPTPESIVQRMLDVQFYAPNLADKPGMAMALALDPHVSKAEVRSIAALELAASRRLHLESLDTQMQMDVWQNLSPVMQRSLLAIGFVPGAVGDAPVMQKEDGGFWGTFKPVVTMLTPQSAEDEVLGALGTVGDGLSKVGDGLSWVGDKAGDALSWAGDTQVGEGVQQAGAGISDSMVGDAVGTVGGLMKDNVGHLVEAGMWALETPQELVFQDMRAFRILQDRDDLSFTSFDDIAEAFSIAEDGNRSYDTEYLAEAQSKINNDDLYNLALEVNSLPEDERGDWLARKVEQAGGPDGDQAAMIDMYTKLQSSDFANAMDMVDGAHISFGRMVAQDYGLTSLGESDFDLISGSLDFTARVTLDPWLLAGAGSKGAKAARYGINLGRKVEDAGAFSTRVDEIMRLKTTRRFWEGTDNNGALSLLNTIRNSDDPAKVADATRRLKRYGGIDDTMNQAILRADKDVWKFDDADDVAAFVKSEHGKAAVFTGKAAFRMTALQKKNLLEHAIAQIKPGKVADWLDMKAGVAIEKVGATRGEMGLTDDMVEGGAKVDMGAFARQGLDGDGFASKAVRAEAVGNINKATGSIINNAWQKKFWYRANVMLTRLTTKVPVPKDGKLFLDDADAVANINAMARTFGPRAWADNVTAAFAVANDVGRRQIYKGMMETLGEASGITRDAAGKKMWSEYVSRSGDDAYSSLTGADDIGNGQKAALYAHQLRNHVEMPDFSLMHAQAQRIGVLGKMGGHFTREGYDWFVQRAFKPSVLLRPALVLRNAGEEVLRHVVDNGPKSYMQGRLVRSHLRSGMARKGGFVDPMLDEEWRFFRLFTRPAWKAYESVVDTAARKKGTALATRHSVRDWFVGGVIADMRRAFTSRMIGEDTLKVLEELWDTSPRFRRLYAKEVMENSRAAWVGMDSAPKAAAGLASGRFGRAAGGRAGRVEWRETGGYSPQAVEGHEGALRWTIRLDKLAHDDYGMIAMEHLDDPEKAMAALREVLSNDPLAKKALMGQRMGVDEWARRIYDDVRFHFVGENGQFQQKLFDKLVPAGDDGVRRIDYEAFDADAIDELIPSVDDRPLHVTGRQMEKVIERNNAGLISRIIDGGFDYIGEATNHISRGPLFFANMVDAIKDTRPLYKAAQEAGVPARVINAERRAFAKKVMTDGDGVPVTLYHGSDVKYDRLSSEYANRNIEYGAGVEFTDQESIARRFANPDAEMASAFNSMLDDASDLAINGHVHSVWVKKGKMLNVNESLDLDTFEKIARTFAKKGGLDDNWVNGQLFRAASNGGGKVDDLYQSGRQSMTRKSDAVSQDDPSVPAPHGGTDMPRLNEAFEATLKAHKYKGFTREYSGKTITHVIDDSYIMPDKYPAVGGAVTRKWAKQQMLKVAEQRALERTLRFVDNPIYRSQFSVIARNLFPFWRAQEEFYRRWANTFKHSPESFRKAQLMMMGFEHSGFVQKDDEGHSYFVYPYIGEATEAFRKFGEKLGVDLGMIPQVTQYSGQIRFLNQGIDPNNLQPAVSPLLSFPTALLTKVYPEMQPLENLVAGEQGAGRNPYTALLPTPIRRLIEAGFFGQDGEWTEQMLSAAQNSVAALEAAGLTPPDDASADEIDAYLERVREYSKFTLTMRAVWGALAPTPLDQMDKSPELPEHLQFDGVRTFDQQFMDMVESMGYEKAITFWAEANPDMVPFTESKTESVSGAYWNSTEKAGEFYKQNRELFDKYPRAATFLFPLDEEGKWDPDVYSIEMANGLRVRKDMLQFYKDMKLNGQVTEWYNSKANAEQAVADAVRANDYVLAQRYQDSYDEWAKSYEESHPLLKEYRAYGAPRALERENLVNDMREMLPHAPQSEATEVIADMIGSFDNYKKALTASAGSTSAAELQRKLLTASYNKYMEKIAKTNDNAWLFYNRTFRYMEN